MVIWEVLNLRYGTSAETMRERYRMYREGEITYAQWVKLDAEVWLEAGATRRDIVDAVGEFRMVDGATDTVHELKRRGYKLGVISGTIDVVLDTLFPDHPFDDVFTNELHFDDDGRLRSWRATPFDGHGKRRALEEIAGKHNIPLERTAFIGDGENDVPLLGLPGYFVAYQPKAAELERGADLVIKDEGLHGLLDVFNK